MIERFQGERGKILLIETLSTAKLLQGNQEAAEYIVTNGSIESFNAGDTFIEQEDSTNDIFLIIHGQCSIVINARKVGSRGPGDHVGEMAAIMPSQPRSASVVATTDMVCVKLSEEQFSIVAVQHPLIYRYVAQELARRLLQRNSLVGAYRDKTKIFIISSVEAIPIARVVADAFEHDDFETHLWTDGCFKVANYTLDDLEAQVDRSDFAIAIAHTDDVTESRSEKKHSPRDNVIFELGLFMGRLGRSRAILMEPMGTDIKLPSDLSGVKSIGYTYRNGDDNARLMRSAYNKLRTHIVALGPNNG